MPLSLPRCPHPPIRTVYVIYKIYEIHKRGILINISLLVILQDVMEGHQNALLHIAQIQRINTIQDTTSNIK